MSDDGGPQVSARIAGHGPRCQWHWRVQRTLLFWIVGLFNTVFIRPEDAGRWKHWVGWGFVALAMGDSALLARTAVCRSRVVRGGMRHERGSRDREQLARHDGDLIVLTILFAFFAFSAFAMNPVGWGTFDWMAVCDLGFAVIWSVVRALI